MISILASGNGQATQYIEKAVASLALPYQLIVSNNSVANRHFVNCCNGGKVVILVGDVFWGKQIVASSYGLAMYYDKQMSKAIIKHYADANQPNIPQHMLDIQCSIPEGFVHFNQHSGIAGGCCGKIGNCQVFVISNFLDIAMPIYNNYARVAIDKIFGTATTLVYKVFGISKKEIMAKLNNAVFKNKFVSHNCETNTGLDSRITFLFNNATAKQRSSVDSAFCNAFGHSIYSKDDRSLAHEVVATLMSMHKTLSVAESITGGLISSSIVDIEGASKVFLEGAVTYSPIAKQDRLSINPHMIDAYGVVSNEVAREMAVGSKAFNNSDFALSITGYAGPIASDNKPVGLCYIGVANHLATKTYKVQFTGTRQHIREQATNSALFLLLNTIKNVTM